MMTEILNQISQNSSIIIEMIQIVMIAWVITSLPILKSIQSIKKDWLNIITILKTLFNCIKCMSFWTSLIFILINYNMNLFDSLSLAAMTSFIAYLIDLYILKKPIQL